MKSYTVARADDPVPLTGLALGPSSGDRWRANFYRTGVESVSQEASWNPIGTAEKQFHSPGHFGWLVFG